MEFVATAVTAEMIARGAAVSTGQAVPAGAVPTNVTFLLSVAGAVSLQLKGPVRGGRAGSPVRRRAPPQVTVVLSLPAMALGSRVARLLLWDTASLSWKDASATCEQPVATASGSVLTTNVCHFTQVCLCTP